MKQSSRKLEKILNKLPESAIEEIIDFAEFLKRRMKRKVERPTPRKSDFFKLFGTAESGFTDVSGNKYKHLTEIYSDSHKANP